MEAILVLTLKLDNELTSELNRRAEASHVTVSEYVRTAIKEKMQRDARPLFLESARDLVGCIDSGWTDLSETHETVLPAQLHAKYRRQ
jgi:hypothetical protein